jgi:translation initiation factor 4E
MSVTDSGNVGQMENSSAWVKNTGDHALQTAWAFWYDKKQLKKTDGVEFRNKLHKIGSFDTVEAFWKLYLYLRRPSTLEMNVNLYLFRDGPNIAPMWEAFPR